MHYIGSWSLACGWFKHSSCSLYCTLLDLVSDLSRMQLFLEQTQASPLEHCHTRASEGFGITKGKGCCGREDFFNSHATEIRSTPEWCSSHTTDDAKRCYLRVAMRLRPEVVTVHRHKCFPNSDLSHYDALLDSLNAPTGQHSRLTRDLVSLSGHQMDGLRWVCIQPCPLATQRSTPV
jgi:hypothetical protein